MARTVLIADSNTRLSEVLAQLLSDEDGFTVLDVCATAEQALRRAREGRPDVVLVSESLQDRRGVELCTALRDVVPEAIVLLWSHNPAQLDVGADVADAVMERGMTFRDLVREVRQVRPARGQDPVQVLPANEDAPVAVPESAPATGEPDDAMVLACSSCDLRLAIDTRDMTSAVQEARTFFADHDRCATSITLTDSPSSRGARLSSR